MTIGNVYPDPRGKVDAGGNREHVFSVRSGDFIRTMRFRNRDEAERAHAEVLERWKP